MLSKRKGGREGGREGERVMGIMLCYCIQIQLNVMELLFLMNFPFLLCLVHEITHAGSSDRRVT